MGRRVVYGHSFSENGWPMVDTGSCSWVKVPGAEHVSLQIQNGHPLTILRAFAADYHAYVEPLRDADSACWTATNSVSTSNHLSGTAMDLNWNGADGKTFRLGISAEQAFPGNQLGNLRDLLDFYEGVVFNGGAWSIRDWMHAQLGGGTFNHPKTVDFIARKIRADGFSTYRRGNTAQPAAAGVLARATGVSAIKAPQILDGVRSGLRDSQCTNPNRIAMWLAQIGHESAGFSATEEYASGDAYEGRTDLGNTKPGDGKRFKGRSWIQITGRHNYTQLSAWAHGLGLVPSREFFVEQPSQLATPEYAGLGPAWYWVVARPDINALSDKRDLITVTKRINGGTNGLADRQARYDRASALGDQLMALTSGPTGELEELLMSTELSASRSIYRTSDTKTMTLRDAIFGADACAHMGWVEQAALSGDPWAIELVGKLATGNLPASSDPWAVNRARHIITVIRKAIDAQGAGQ